LTVKQYNIFISSETKYGYISAAIVFIALVFNFILCFINTNAIHINNITVIASEICLISWGMAIVIKGNQAFYATTIGFISFALFLSSVKGTLDMKSIRDILIPITFIFLGRHFGTVQIGDKLVQICVWTVLLVCLCEYFLLPQYIKIIDIRSYYIARGTVESAAVDTTGTGLFASGIRPEGRTLLPFLGAHRVSSIFLEPVSVGNFGAVVFAWTVLRNTSRPLSMALKLIPITTIFIFADARFGLMLSLMTFLIYPLAKHVGWIQLLLAPFVVLLLLATIGFLNPDAPVDNGLGGRVLAAGQILAQLDFWEAMGFVPVARFVADSGYTYTLTKFGLLGCVGLWGLFILRPVSDEQAWRYRLFTAFYIMSLLTISDSLYSIKTAALLWYLLGCLEGQHRQQAGAKDELYRHGAQTQNRFSVGKKARSV
jgi:putative polymerase